MSKKLHAELATRKTIVGEDKSVTALLASPTEEDLAIMFGLPDNPTEDYTGMVAFLESWQLAVDSSNIASALLMAIKKGWPHTLCVSIDHSGDKPKYTWSLVGEYKPKDDGSEWQPSLLD